MMSVVYMFCSRMLHKILRNIYSTGIITINMQSILKNTIVLKHLLHPHQFSTTTSSSNVLCLYSWQRDRILFLTIPRNHVISKIETSTKSAFSIISIPCPICITKSCKTSICIFSKSYTIVSSLLPYLMILFTASRCDSLGLSWYPAHTLTLKQMSVC